MEHPMRLPSSSSTAIFARVANHFSAKLSAIISNHGYLNAVANDNARHRQPIAWTSPRIAELQLVNRRKEMRIREEICDQLVLFGFEDNQPGEPLRGL
jgi:hypothetical protein